MKFKFHNQILENQSVFVLKISDLVVGNYMTAFPLSVLSEVSITETIGFMARRGIGNIVVSDDDGVPLGIFTERELLSLLDTHKSLPDISLSEVNLAKFEKITSDTSVYEAAKTMLAKKSGSWYSQSMTDQLE